MLPPVEERHNYDWALYSARCAEDVPIPGVIRTVELLAQSMGFIIVSARIFTVEALTRNWLAEHLPVEPFRVVLNDVEGVVPHKDYKAYQIKRLLDEGFDVRLHVDDWPPVEDSLAPLGVPCLVVTPPWQKEEVDKVNGFV
jgi:hypothetical protein